ncbi:hypothetical protein ACA910_002722 [Epithemia clementina (nom. ined.)]
MLGLAFAEAHRYHQNFAEQQSEQAKGKKRRLRRKKNKPNAKSLIPPIPVAKFPSRGDRHVARDLYVALRCCWKDERRKQLHRVLLANWEGDCIMDHVLDEGNFGSVRSKLMKKIEGKVLIGHGLDYCLYSLQIQHPWANMRDGATYLPFMQETVDPLTVMFLPRSLSDLMEEILDRQLPEEYSSDYMVQEAKGCMDLYRSVRYEWENEITKLIQQKERQREVKLEARQPVQLTSISEDADQYTEDASTAQKVVAGKKAPPITTIKSADDHPEDQSTQAPTEFTHEGEDASVSVRDDLSVKTKTSDQSIWMPPESISEDGSKGTAGSYGLWLPRPAKESTHPIDADDWLNEEMYSDKRLLKPEEMYQPDEESFCHLPSRLLNDSSSDDSDSSIPVREESNHFVEGMDWLQPDLGLRRSTNSRDRITGRRKKSPHRAKHFLLSIQEDSFYPRGQGDKVRNRSNHSSVDEWLPEERESSTSKFSFFRKRSSATDDSPRSPDRSSRLLSLADRAADGDEEIHVPRLETQSTHPMLGDGLDWIEEGDNVGTPSSRFSLFRRKSIGERNSEANF